jgi:hypothetical protein
MRARRVTRSKVKVPKRTTTTVYRDLEIAMERRALEMHTKPRKKTETNEINNWIEAEADMLESL